MIEDCTFSNAVGDKEIALHFWREVSTGNHRASGERTCSLWIKGGELIGGVATGCLGDAAILAAAGVFQWIVKSPT